MNDMTIDRPKTDNCTLYAAKRALADAVIWADSMPDHFQILCRDRNGPPPGTQDAVAKLQAALATAKAIIDTWSER